jgi:hypothetical protein
MSDAGRRGRAIKNPINISFTQRIKGGPVKVVKASDRFRADMDNLRMPQVAKYS